VRAWDQRDGIGEAFSTAEPPFCGANGTELCCANPNVYCCILLSLQLIACSAGKGTQCARIVDRFGFVHLSAGDLLRAEREKGGETGEMIDRLIREGQIVPVKVTLDLLRAAMEDNMAQGRFLFLIDGFPRNQDNLDGWNREMADFAQVDFCLNLDCPEEVMEARLLKRGETSGRTDDNAEAIKKRFVQSTTHTHTCANDAATIQ